MRSLFLVALLAACGGDAGKDGDGTSVAAGDPVAVRRLRLLTVDEYRNSVRALFPALAASSCASTPDCNLTAQSCVNQACVADPCSTHTFVLRTPSGSANADVVVAGSFNGWAGSSAAGGLKMTWVPSQSLYFAKTTLSDATHAYKFVVDGSWMEDPGNPQTTPDGFGGNNSIVVQQCAGAPASDGAFDPTEGFSPDTRPEGFPFDTFAEGGLVTSPRAEQYLDAGARVAGVVLRDPDAALGCPSSDDTCVTGWLRALQTDAWRRPVTAAETDALLALVQGADSRPEGLSTALQAVLSSPNFLYRSEVGAPAADGFVLDGAETAAAMSYFLWGGPPDDTLTTAATSGQLATSDGRRQQAQRMMADPRAREGWRRFVTQWMGVAPILTADKSPALFPNDTAALRAEMLAETVDFANEVLFVRDGTLDDLLTATWTVAGPNLRRLYGLAEGSGVVDLPPERAGLLGQAAFLASFAHSDQSSPFRRGVALRTRLLCEVFGTPPPSAGGVPDVDPNATTRERFEQHSDSPACAACHKYIDPVGLGLETFDALGAHRTTENGLTIDPSGDMNDVEGQGTHTSAPFTDLRALGATIAASDAAPRCLVAQVARFALGVKVDPDDPRIEPLVTQFEASGHKLSELLIAVAASDLMVERSAP